MVVEQKPLPVTTEEESRQPPPGKMTYEEFLTWANEDTLAEWVAGEVIMYSPSSLKHQRIMQLLFSLLSFYVEAHNLGEVITPPFQMRLETRPSGREPDLIFVADEHLERLKDTYLDGAADLVVEIVSPESEARDRGEKFYEYEMAAVGEYWLIDPERRRAEFYHLGEDGLFRFVSPEAEGVYHAQVVPGFWLRVEWLWQEPPPSLRQILAAEDEWRSWL